MSSDKKITIIRLVIFLVIACVPVYLITIAVNDALGAPMYSTPELSADPLTMLAGLGMLLPALANIVTRLVTKQGFRDAMLEFNFEKGRIKYYVMAIAVPLVYGAIGNLLTFLHAGADLGGIFSTEYLSDTIPMALSMPPMILIGLSVFFGEEFGWRGYLMPQLEKLMPLPAAVIVGGVIWGLWHAPMTVSGHNFGMEYAGFPYVGILLMCVDCVCMGSFLTLISRRTKSVWPAAIAHGVNNNCSVLLLLFFLNLNADPAAAGTQQDRITSMLVYFIPILVTGVVSYIMLCVDYKKEKSAKAAA